MWYHKIVIDMSIKKIFFFLLALPLTFGLLSSHSTIRKPSFSFQLIVLGTAQDGGYPQAGCTKECCQYYFSGKEPAHTPTCLGIVDQVNNKCWMFEATPSFPEQLKKLLEHPGLKDKKVPDGIFLTHAHVGHYAGLINLGREIMGTKDVPVYVMPKMADFIRNNGPWSQLVKLENIRITELQEDSAFALEEGLSVIPLIVPHRDEFSETVGFRIETKEFKILFIPDIDKWEKWKRSIIDEIKKVDIAFIDGTFYKDGELSGRSMKEVPHPFVSESLELFKDLPSTEKQKVTFIHFNHTNPLNWDKKTREELNNKGFNYATEGMILEF
jgi:pyrroloquinoline quinone biosynthesis protein B